MAMDQTDKMGLGVAVGGHILLLGAMVLGLFMSTERLKKPEPIAVSLVGEVAEVSTAPDAIQEEPAPPAAAEAEPVEPPPSPVMQIEKPVEKPQIKTVEKPAKRDVPVPTKAAVKKVPVKQPPAKTKAVAITSGKGSTPAKPGGLSRSVLDAINDVGKAPGTGKAIGTPAAKTGSEVRRAISVSINAEVRGPWNRCKFSGVDVDQLKTVVQFGLNRDGSLKNVRSVATSGQNDSNKFQVNRHQECAKLAVSQASPFNLPAENYDFWKDYELELFKK